MFAWAQKIFDAVFNLNRNVGYWYAASNAFRDAYKSGCTVIAPSGDFQGVTYGPPSGVYLYRITAGDFTRTHRMVLTK